MFEDWKEKTKGNPQVSRHLLWDVDYDRFDFQKGKSLVVQRVIERGGFNDFYAIFMMYGGIDGVRDIIKRIRSCFSAKDETFVLTVFNLKKEELQCYIYKQLREIHLNS